MEFIPSPRSNKQLLVFEQHIYCEQKKLAGNIILWECVNRRNRNACSARIKTLNGILHGRAPDHRCQPDPAKIQTMKVRGQMKQRAQNTIEKTRDILSGAVAGQNEEVLARLPKEEILKRTIRRSRQVANVLPPVPQPNDLHFVIPQAYSVTKEGDAFLQVDSLGQGHRLIMFGSQRSMHFLSTADHWYMDGTFNTLPPQCLQLYTIHGIKNGRNVIGFYALLTNKLEVTYQRMLRHVQFCIGGSQPLTINIDFERAAINACQNVFPQSFLRCCFFHLCQNVYKKFQEYHLRILYDQDVIFRTNIRMICALAFVPPPEIVHAFDMLCLYCGGAGANEQPILEYFENAYIGVMRGGVRGRPLFCHSLWNVYDRVMNDLPRTTNAVD